MTRNNFSRWGSTLRYGAVCLAAGLLVCVLCLAPVSADGKATSQPASQPATQPADTLSIKGTFNFGGTNGPWSATLTPKGNGLYDVVYAATWGGRPLTYAGQIKTDWKTQIMGIGKASGGGANGTFEWTGKFGNDGVAKCVYKEDGGRRNGTMTAEMPK